MRGIAAVALWLLAEHTAAQSYPAKPVKMIIPFPAGGPTDILGRLVGQKLTEAWGHTVVIDNRPGGGGVIAGQLAAQSPPDGYTIFLGGITTLVLSTYVHKKRPYDSQRDFLPVTQTTVQPLLLMVHPALPVKTVKEFLALVRARPGEINYGTSGPGAGQLHQIPVAANPSNCSR